MRTPGNRPLRWRKTLDNISLGILFTGVLLVLILLFSMPVGLSMALAGAAGIYFIAGSRPLFNILSQSPYTTASDYVFTVIPMFVLMGWLAAESQISSDMFIAINKWIGWIRGGLAMAVSLACAAFGAVCGDSITTAVTMTSIALPEMRKNNYSDRLSTGILAAGGNLGFMIPPSIAFIIYGIITETSIGHLFVAGILPGVLLAFAFCLAIYIICRFDPTAGPAGKRVPFVQALKVPVGTWLMIVLALVVLGGIYAGIFTPTEAGGVGAFATLVFGLVARRLHWSRIKNSLIYTIKTTGMIFILIIGAIIFSRMLALSTVPFALTDLIAGLSVNRYIVLALILIVFIILGFFLDIMSILLIMLPVMSPVVSGLGFDLVWFGVLVVVTVLMGQISPPVGIVVFAVAGVAKDVPMMDVFKGAMPFFYTMGICLIILIAFPAISLILPRMMSGGG
jgi:C4-dicarboxylate transporter, DctM subunit